MKLKDVCAYRNESISLNEAQAFAMYISTDSMAPNRGAVTGSALPISGKVKHFLPGDTLVSNIRPYFKKIWHAGEEGTCSNDVLIFQPQSCSSDYLHWLLNDDEFFDYVTKTSKGTKMPRGDKKAIMEYEVRIPSEDEQASICAVMNALQSKIDLNAQINDYLAELIRSACRSLYRKYELKDEPLPGTWKWAEIQEIADFVSRGITPKYDEESEETVLGQTCIRNNLVLVENGRHHKPKKINEKWLRYGDLLINSTGVGSLGRTAQVWFEPNKLVVDSHVTIVRANDPDLIFYLGFWAFTHEKYIESLHTGSTGQTELPRDHVKSICLPVPDGETLDAFNALAKPATKIIVANQTENKKLAALRDTLLSKLMSGEIDASQVDLTQLNNHLSVH